VVGDLAEHQHGVVSREQLLGLGLGQSLIDHWVHNGRLYLIHAGVYAVGHRRLDRHGRWRAAVLACGPGAVLSHRDAAHLWGFRRSARRDIDVTALGRTRHRRRGLTVHRPRSLHEDDVIMREGIPVTTVPRTLLDLAEVIRPQQLRRAFEESQRLELFDLSTMHALLGRSRGRRGVKPLNVLLAEEADAPTTKEELEYRFADFIRDFGLPQPIYNATVAGYEVDTYWPDLDRIVELHSFEFHGKTHAQHERDSRKWLDLQLAGYVVTRVTWRMLNDPERLAEQLRAFLAPATSPP
jgi:hypothetical protein